MSVRLFGVELRPEVEMNTQDGRRDLYFSHDLSIDDRTVLADNGIPVFFDILTGFRYVTVDTALLNWSNKSSQIVHKCECGASAVQASRHSTWCPMEEVSRG